MIAFISKYVLHPRRTVQFLYDISVFKPIRMSEIVGAEKVMVALFHRAAATKYLLYSMWAIAASLGGIPSIADTAGEAWQLAFSLVVALICIPATIGATWFPKTGRLEMFAGSSLVMLLMVYFGFLNYRAVTEGTLSPAITSILIFSLCVLPAARVTFVYRYLIEAEQKRKTMEAISTAEDADDDIG